MPSSKKSAKSNQKGPRELSWIEDLLPKAFLRKSMFGGFAYYVDDKMVLAIFEKTGDKSYRHLHFDFELWNGCMFPVEKDLHQNIQDRFPFLINHPILPKWFYLPSDTENFENLIEDVMKELRRPQSLIGVIPERKKKKAAKAQKKSTKEKLDTRRPKMFSER